MTVLLTITFVGILPERQNSAGAQTQKSVTDSDWVATKERLKNVINGIVAVWDKADVVCLGEGHGSKNDSDLRLALIEHPDFARKVNAVIVEFADSIHQDTLDRFALDCESMPREKLREVWKDTSGKEVWESPIYEAFLQAVRRINLPLPRERRVRLIAGDNSTQTNRGRFIREAVGRELLDKKLKALAIYGSGHCECRAMGFPGELSAKYPGRIWSAFTFYTEEGIEEGRRRFGLGDEPTLIPVSGTERAKIPIGKMFFLGRYNDPATLGDITNSIVYYGNIRDVLVRPEKR